MKAASCRERVDDLRKTPKSNTDEWRGAEKDGMKKVIYRVSAFSEFDLNSWSPNTLLDSAASVHFFNIKERFSNFKRAIKGQGLLFGSKFIAIEGWGQISLPLKVKSRIKLLILNNVAYISNFPLNLVSLECLQKCGFDWFHRSGKISKNNQIIGYTRFHVNNYEIDNDKNSGIVFANLAADSATLRNSRSYHRPHSAATLDTRYNLDVKVIRSDNEMNRIKTIEWCNRNGIFFEPCPPDTHAQNGGAERFRRLIMEKAWEMCLPANLLH